MTGMFAINEDSVTTVRCPVFKVAFGGGSASGGLSAAVGLVQGADDPWARSVVTVNVESGLAPFVDAATLELAADEEAPQVGLDDEGTISLGYNDGGAELAFTARIDNINYNLNGTQRITGINGGGVLSRLRINQSYEQQSAGDIVSDLASQAGVDTDTVESGVDFPFYVLDDRSNAYQHIAILARKSGYITYFTTEGKLYFGPYADGQAVQTFSYGVDILSLQVKETRPIFGSVTTIGQGAAGAEGQEAWGWLIKDPGAVTAEAGQGQAMRLKSDASLRSSEASQSAADGIAAAAGRTALTGTIVVPGAPRVVVGSSIEIADAPNDNLNGTCMVCWMRHHYSKQQGYISVIDFSKSAGESGLGGFP